MPRGTNIDIPVLKKNYSLYFYCDQKRRNKMAGFKPLSEVMKYFYYRIAIIKVRVGETNDEAWQRHLMETPKDINATIRVFNC
jgi:hypothetical protein